MLDFITKTVGVIFLFFVVCGIYELNKPLPAEDETVQKTRSELRKEAEVNMYPVQLEADFCHSTIPSLKLKISDRNTLKTIMPGRELNWDYKIDKLVYFKNEADPVGACLTLTAKDRDPEILMIHRKKSYFHTHFINQVRFVEGGTFEDLQKIEKALSDNSLHIKNNMDVELAKSYAELPKPAPQTLHDNNSKESWMEAFAILGRVSRDMQEITKPAVEGMAGAFKEIKK